MSQILDIVLGARKEPLIQNIMKGHKAVALKDENQDAKQPGYKEYPTDKFFYPCPICQQEARSTHRHNLLMDYTCPNGHRFSCNGFMRRIP